MRDVPIFVPPEEKPPPSRKKKGSSIFSEEWGSKAWGDANRARSEKAQFEHEKKSQEFLARAEQAKTSQELHQLFLDAKVWHHQKDLIFWAAENKNQTGFDFLRLVRKNIADIDPKTDDKKNFYTDEDFIPMRSWDTDELHWIPTSFEDMIQGDFPLFDYEEYLVRILAGSFGKFDDPEYKAQAEVELLSLMDRLPAKTEQFRHERDRYRDPETAEDDQGSGESDDHYLLTVETTADLFGYDDDMFFNRTYVEILQSLGRVGSEKSLQAIVQLTRTKPIELYGVMADTLSKISPGKAAHEMLQMLKDEDPWIKRTAAKILYRLEFGKIGISEEGLNYLDRMYDLGEFNSSQYFAQRLTANGEIGIFERVNEKLLKYLQLSDPESAEKKIRGELYELTYRDLFTDRVDLPEAERENRKRLLQEFQEKYFAFAQSELFAGTGTKLNNLTFREQAWFLEFSTKATPEQKNSIKSFVKRFREAGIRAFLVMENGGSGEKILELAERLKPKEAQAVFDTYLKITYEAETALRKIREVTKNLGGAELFDDTLFDNLLEKAKNSLIAGHEFATAGKSIMSVQGYFIDVFDLNQLLLIMHQEIHDLRRFNTVVTDWQSFKNEGIKILDHYILDTKNLEGIKNVSLDMEIYRSDEVKIHGVFDRAGKTKKHVGGLYEIGHFYEKDIDSQKTYLFAVDNREELHHKHHKDLQHFYTMYLEKYLRGEQLPAVIVYSKNGLPLYEKASYPQFLFADNEDELVHAIFTAKDIRHSREMQPEFMSSEKLAGSQERLYDNSDLREWEGKTADTAQSLTHLLRAIETAGVEKRAIIADETPQVFLDLGTGEGRISTLLAMLGKKVVGLDISQSQLDKIPHRLQEEVQKFQKDKSSPLRVLMDQGIVQETDVITDIVELQKHLYTVKGNFLDLERDVYNGLVELPEKQGMDPVDFFEASPHDENFWDTRDSLSFFGDTAFDGVTLNWHTFCEAGAVSTQKQVLEDIFKMLHRGGLVYIEVPDRTIGNYARTLSEYHKGHPDEPYGTIRDETSTEQGKANRMGEGEDTARFFPGRDELRNLLRQVGFEDVKIDTYLITSKDKDGNEFLEVKELVFTAQKPVR